MTGGKAGPSVRDVACWMEGSLLVGLLVAAAACGGTEPSCNISAVTISPSGASVGVDETLALAAAVTSSSCGNVTITWTSATPNVAGVSGSAATATVTGMAAGQTIITATATAGSTTMSGTVSVTVTPAQIGTITVTPPASTVESGKTQALTAEIRSTKGRVLTDRSVTWTSSNNAVAIVSGSSGSAVVTAQGIGAAVITAASEGRTGSATIQVTAPSPASVRVTPATAQMQVGGSASLQAEVRDAGGNLLPNASVAWSSANVTIVGVSGSGANATLTGTAVGGPVRVTATAGTASGFADVTVTSIPVASVVVAPTTAQVNVGSTVSLTARTLDAAGTELVGRSIIWTSSNTAIATVTGNGSPATVTGGSAGSATITATSEGKSASATVTVAAASQATVLVAPHNLNLPMVGGSTSAIALQLDAAGNPQSGVAFVWSSSNPSIASVNSAGLIQATGVGTATITASGVGGTFGTMTVSVFAEYDFVGCVASTVSCYARSKGVESYDASVTRAARFGALLASVTDPADQTLLANNRSGVNVWIGLHDKVTDGVFFHEDDSPAASFFRNFETGQPENGNAEHCVLMDALSARWHDYPCTDTYKSFFKWNINGFVNWIQDLKTFGGHRYARTTSITSWAQADVLARMMGGHLVKIENAQEQAFLASAFGTTFDYWIGLNDRTTLGTYRWTDGAAASFTNWETGEPSHSQGVGSIVERCVHLWGGHNGRWNDNTCFSRNPSPGMFAIIEWDTMK